MSAKCGTVSGYQRHRSLGQEACAECRAANAKYKRDYLARAPKAKAKQDAYRSAWQRAATALVNRHRGEFEELLERELDGAS